MFNNANVKRYFYEASQIKETKDRKFMSATEKANIKILMEKVDALTKEVAELKAASAAPAPKAKATKKAAAKEEKAEE